MNPREAALLRHMDRIHRELGELIKAGKEKAPYVSRGKKENKCLYCGLPCLRKSCKLCRPLAVREYVDRTKGKMKIYQKAYRDRKRKERQGQ